MFQILIIRIYFLSIFSSLFVALWGSCMGLMRVNQVLLNSLSKEGNSELKESKQRSFFPPNWRDQFTCQVKTPSPKKYPKHRKIST